MAENNMTNIDIRDFPVVSAADLSDFVILSLFSGKSARMSVGLFRNSVTKGLRPSIGEDGYWYVGEASTYVQAEGKTPEFRKSSDCIEFKYGSEGEERWRPLVYYNELRLRYDDLTAEQRKDFKFGFEDFTEEELHELQRPAIDAAEKVLETEKNVRIAESVRQGSEQERVLQEEMRAASAEEMKANERERMYSEMERNESEERRVKAETKRIEADAERKEDYERIRNSLVTESMILVLSEQEYENAISSGSIDNTKLYFAFED